MDVVSFPPALTLAGGESYYNELQAGSLHLNMTRSIKMLAERPIEYI